MRPEQSTLRVHKDCSLDSFPNFPSEAAMWDVEAEKPNPACYKLASQQLGKDEHTPFVLVEDSNGCWESRRMQGA